MIVVHAAGERKAGRGRGDQEVEHHLLPGTRHKTETTFSYIPTKSYIFLHSRTIHNHRALLSGDQQSGPRVTPRAGKRALCCRSGEPGNPTPVVCVARDPTQFYVILHNSTRSYIILHNPSPISACLKILQLCRNPTFPCNSPQICQNLLKNSFSLETQAKPC